MPLHPTSRPGHLVQTITRLRSLQRVLCRPFQVLHPHPESAPLSRLFSITRPSTIDPFHQTSIEEALPSITSHFLVYLSRVATLYRTHSLSPAGPMRISRYHADHLLQLRPS